MMSGEEQHPAVLFENVWKSYGVRKSKVDVLKGININISKGSIYGLLGPSGCGKTTALHCIVGRLCIDKGVIQVFGYPPGSKFSGIPGHNVGYMPQDLALFKELTIGETLRYFGRLHYMTAEKVTNRMEFLVQFLNLPEDRRLIKNLSGGQQRRVSFAAALLHEPPLLILDEPTVGVDPLLRESVWEHLIEISNYGKTTIIITTHYIEEAQKAHKVGFMRNGHVLIEGQPEQLMQQFSLTSLESVFLQICHASGSDCLQPSQEFLQQEEPENSSSKWAKPAEEVERQPLLSNSFEDDLNLQSTSHKIRHGLSRTKGLVIKNFIKMCRNWGFLLFQFLIPSIQIILFCLAIGGDPKDLNIAIVNKDTGSLGEKYLNQLNDDIIKQVPVSSIAEAIHRVETLGAWGVVSLGSNFSVDMYQRFVNPTKVSQEVLDGGSIHVRLDMTNQQNGYVLQKEFLSAFQSFLISVLGKNLSQSFSSPVQFGDPIFGPANPQYTEYIAPGVLLSITYFMAVGLTALSFVMERKEGLLDRSYVAGVTAIEVMISHIITQFGVMIIQIALVLIFLIVVFGIASHGPIFWVIILSILQGTCGMTFGFLVSTICDQEHSAIMLSLGSFYPNMLLSGIIWPIEAMPKFLWYISIVLPQTYATEALRCIFSRGFGIEETRVWEGFLITISWIIAFLLLSALVIKIRH